MTKKYLPIYTFLLSLVCFWSCLKQPETLTPIVQSISPSEIKVGEETTLTLNGTDLNDKLEIESSSIRVSPYFKINTNKTQLQVKVIAQEGGNKDLRIKYFEQIKAWPILCKNAEVYTLSPDTVIVGTPQTFTITGKGLDEKIEIVLNDFTPISYKVSPKKTALNFTAEALKSGHKQVVVSHYQTVVNNFTMVAKYPSIENTITPTEVYLGKEAFFSIKGKDLNSSISLSLNGFTPIKNLNIDAARKTLSFAATPLQVGHHALHIKCKESVIKTVYIDVKGEVVENLIDSIVPKNITNLNQTIQFKIYGKELEGVTLDPIPDFSTVKNFTRVSKNLIQFEAVALHEGTKTLLMRNAKRQAIKALHIEVKQDVVTSPDVVIDSIRPNKIKILNQSIQFKIYGKEIERISLDPVPDFSTIKNFTRVSKNLIQFEAAALHEGTKTLVIRNDKGQAISTLHIEAKQDVVISPDVVIDSIRPNKVEHLNQTIQFKIYGKQLEGVTLDPIPDFSTIANFTQEHKGLVRFEAEALREGTKTLLLKNSEGSVIKVLHIDVKGETVITPTIAIDSIVPRKITKLNQLLRFTLYGKELEGITLDPIPDFSSLASITRIGKELLQFEAAALHEGIKTLIIKNKRGEIIKTLNLNVKQNVINDPIIAIDSIIPRKVTDLNQPISFKLYGQELTGVKVDPIPDFSALIGFSQVNTGMLTFEAAALREGTKTLVVKNAKDEVIKILHIEVQQDVVKNPVIVIDSITPRKVTALNKTIRFKLHGKELTKAEVDPIPDFSTITDLTRIGKGLVEFETAALHEGTKTVVVRNSQGEAVKALHIEVKQDVVVSSNVVIDSIRPNKITDLSQAIKFKLYGKKLTGVSLDPIPDFSALADFTQVNKELIEFKATALRGGIKTLVIRDNKGRIVSTLGIDVTAYLPPIVDSITPSVVPHLDKEVEFTLHGKNLSADISIDPINSFGVIPNLNMLSSSKISFRVKTPPNPRASLVSIRDRNHKIFKTLLLNAIDPEPIVDSISPKEIRLGSDRIVSVYGKNLSAKMTLAIDGLDATLVKLNVNKSRVDFEVKYLEFFAGQKSVAIWSNFKQIKTLSLLVSCPETMSFDGETYSVVRIGTQCWMGENMKSNSHIEGESWCDSDLDTCKKYGRLYDAIASRDISEKVKHWHLASDEEWKALEKFLGMSDTDLDKRKIEDRKSGSVGKQLSLSSSTGFNALYGGYRNPSKDQRSEKGNMGLFFTNTGDPNLKNSRWYRFIMKDKEGVGRESHLNNIEYKCSLRLVMGDI